MNEVSIELRGKINWSDNRTGLHKVIGRTRDDDVGHHKTRSDPSSDSDWFNFNFEKETWNETCLRSSDPEHFMVLNDFFSLMRMSNQTWWFRFIVYVESCSEHITVSHARKLRIILGTCLDGRSKCFVLNCLCQEPLNLSDFSAFFSTFLLGLLWRFILYVKTTKIGSPIATGNYEIDFQWYRRQNFALKASRVASATPGISEMLNKKNVCRIRLIEQHFQENRVEINKRFFPSA